MEQKTCFALDPAENKGQGIQIQSPKEWKRKVVLWDLGAAYATATGLLVRGCQVVFVPLFSTAQGIMEFEPDGILLSNGPCDLADNTAIIRELALLARTQVPMLGMGLGRQLLAQVREGVPDRLAANSDSSLFDAFIFLIEADIREKQEKKRREKQAFSEDFYLQSVLSWR